MKFVNDPERERLHLYRDEELLDAFRQTSETRYFAFLFHRHLKQLYDICFDYLGHKEDCRDVVMHIFFHSLEKAPHQSIHHFKSWLLSLARNECINQLRDRARQEKEQQVYAYLKQGEQSGPEKKSHEETPELQLGRALSRLRPEQRHCIELFYFENKSYREIAQLTASPIKEVKSHLQNGRRKLKKLLLTVRSPGFY